MSTVSSEMFNHKVRNINSVLLIYTDSGIYISQTSFGNGKFAFENSAAKEAFCLLLVVIMILKSLLRSLFNLITVVINVFKDIPFTFHEFCISIAWLAISTRYNKSISSNARIQRSHCQVRSPCEITGLRDS